MLTAYDYTMAALLDSSDIDILLVGDSLGSVVCGEENTLSVSMEQMLYHTSLVSKAANSSFVISDLPFLSYQVSDEAAVENAGLLVKEGGASGVKLEGGSGFTSTIERIVRAGVPVMGHLGLLPQSVHQLGGYKVQAKNAEDLEKLVTEAKRLEDSGVFAILLETVPENAGEAVTAAVGVPTISVGAGRNCSGVCMVSYDMFGITEKSPKFAKRYASMANDMRSVTEAFIRDVRSKEYPAEEHLYGSDT